MLHILNIKCHFLKGNQQELPSLISASLVLQWPFPNIDFILVIHLVARFWLEVLFAAEIILSHHFGGCCLPFIVPFTLTRLQRISICWQHIWSSEIYQHTSHIIPCSHFCWHCLLWTLSWVIFKWTRFPAFCALPTSMKQLSTYDSSMQDDDFYRWKCYMYAKNRTNEDYSFSQKTSCYFAWNLLDVLCFASVVVFRIWMFLTMDWTVVYSITLQTS